MIKILLIFFWAFSFVIGSSSLYSLLSLFSGEAIVVSFLSLSFSELGITGVSGLLVSFSELGTTGGISGVSVLFVLFVSLVSFWVLGISSGILDFSKVFYIVSLEFVFSVSIFSSISEWCKLLIYWIISSSFGISIVLIIQVKGVFDFMLVIANNSSLI